ncbi:unnamed protein product [Bursaphelenchus okinawaensis]|uniref:Piwi domain-containing protein n=1 Tax=Bursaphelenchus okinawaensis TaxID=465554 RepID=A0A811LP23_9BILA|nr:unnamed protein product [Bursaphelenchus okinawaensis]CAG9124743.1 unnamed protein product [Bursaphelenchus okinawaensis]
MQNNRRFPPKYNKNYRGNGANSSSNSTLNGLSNIFEINPKPGLKVYRYDVEIIIKGRVDKLLTKQSDAGLKNLKRNVCLSAVESLYKKAKLPKYVYDGKTILFLTTSISKISETVKPAELPEAESAGEQTDHSHRQFLELATSQYPVNSGQYEAVLPGTLFETKTKSLVPGMELRVGFTKGVRVVEQNGKLKALLIIDMRRTAFMTSTKSLAEVWREFPNDKNRELRLTQKNIGDPTFNLENGDSLVDYYKNKYEKNINGEIPGLIADLKTRDGAYLVIPMELAVPLAGQLVPSEKIHEQAVKLLLTENSVFPDARHNFVMNQVREISTGLGGEFLKEFGITVNIASNDIKISKRNVINLERTTNINAVKTYIANLHQTATEAGMQLSQPSLIKMIDFVQLESLFVQAKEKNVTFIFYIDASYVKSHASLKLFESYCKVLSQQILAQNLPKKPQTLKNVVMKINSKNGGINFVPVFAPTLQKYDLKKKSDLMVIGYDVAHPPPATIQDKNNAFKNKKQKNPFTTESESGPLNSLQPSVVGLCANAGEKPLIFGGDFFYQESRRENVEHYRLRKHMSLFAEKAKKAKRPIKRVLIVRDGLSEGQFEYAIKKELPAIREAFKEVFGQQSNIKFTFIVAIKRHNKRFYEVYNGQIQNTKVGHVVDSKVTRTDITEFYLQSHNPLRGVPKMTQYSVLRNELEMSSEELQGMMHALSSMHQISACPTSIPLPVYMADELAKRGADVFKAFNALPDHHIIKKKINAGVGLLKDFTAVTNWLGYATDQLSDTRDVASKEANAKARQTLEDELEAIRKDDEIWEKKQIALENEEKKKTLLAKKTRIDRNPTAKSVDITGDKNVSSCSKATGKVAQMAIGQKNDQSSHTVNVNKSPDSRHKEKKDNKKSKNRNSKQKKKKAGSWSVPGVRKSLRPDMFARSQVKVRRRDSKRPKRSNSNIKHIKRDRTRARKSVMPRIRSAFWLKRFRGGDLRTTSYAGTGAIRKDDEVWEQRQIALEKAENGLKNLQRNVCLSAVESLYKKANLPEYVYNGKTNLFLTTSAFKISETVKPVELPEDEEACCRNNEF